MIGSHGVISSYFSLLQIYANSVILFQIQNCNERRLRPFFVRISTNGTICDRQIIKIHSNVETQRNVLIGAVTWRIKIEDVCAGDGRTKDASCQVHRSACVNVLVFVRDGGVHLGIISSTVDMKSDRFLNKRRNRCRAIWI